MKKLILLLCFIFLPLTIVIAGGTVENTTWYIPQNLNNTFYIENTYSKESNNSYIFQIGSTLLSSDCPITIIQKDSEGNVLNNGNSNTFYFLKNGNETMYYEFNIFYKLYKVYVDTVFGKTSHDYPSFSPYKASINLKQVSEEKKDGWKYKTYNYADFYIDFKGTGYNDIGLIPGEYTARLTLQFLSEDYQLIERDLIIKANYLFEDTTTSTLNYSITINPTPESYSINLKPDYTTTSPIADIGFFNSEISSKEKKYEVSNPFQVGISSNANWNYNTIASDYFFKKIGTQDQANNGYNSIEYTLSVIANIGKKAKTQDNDILISAAHLKNNEPLTSNIFSTKTFLNEFKLDATISITIDPAKAANLTSGQYYTTLYYFVIANT